MQYHYALVLRFENAGIFTQPSKGHTMKSFWDDGTSKVKDDRILFGKSRDNRTQDQWIEQKIGTIHFAFIENLIRVFCGMRPISRYRPTCVGTNGNFQEIARRSSVKVESATYQNKEGATKYITEKTTTRKCLDDSWSKTTTPSWTRFRYLLPEELYAKLVFIANDICKCNAEDMLFSNVANALAGSKDTRVKDLIDEVQAASCMPLVHLLLEDGKPHSLAQAGYRGLGPYLKTMVLKSVCDVVRLDGLICVPLFTKELELFGNGSGVATLFDGGLIRIDHITDLDNTTLHMVTAGFKGAQLQ